MQRITILVAVAVWSAMIAACGGVERSAPTAPAPPAADAPVQAQAPPQPPVPQAPPAVVAVQPSPPPPATASTPAPPPPAAVFDELADPRDGRTYVLVDLDAASTLQVRDEQGATVRSVDLPGRFRHARASDVIAPDGLSADGRTLVLEHAAIGSVPSRFLVVDTERVDAPRLIELDGRFSYDALSPKGETLYLTEHLDEVNYRIVPYALASGTLGEAVVVKSTNPLPTEPMQGVPLARVTEGPWVYTLYDGGEHAFVHALNTREGFALCIDLPHGVHAAAWSLELDRPGRLIARDPIGNAAYTVDRDELVSARLAADA